MPRIESPGGLSIKMCRRADLPVRDRMAAGRGDSRTRHARPEVMRSLVSIVLISMSALIFLGCGPSLTDEQVRQIEEATARAEQAAARAEKAETAASQAEREAEHRAREAERSALRPAPHD